MSAWQEEQSSPNKKFGAAEVIANAIASAYARNYPALKKEKKPLTLLQHQVAQLVLKAAVTVGYAGTPEAALILLRRDIRTPRQLGAV